MAKSTSKKAAQAEQLRISQIGDFKKRIGGLIELPSGAVVQFRNPGGLQVFMNAGVIPNGLMAIIQDALAKGKAPKTTDILKDGKLDPSMIADMMRLMDEVTIKCIIEPPIQPRLTQEDVDRYNAEHPNEVVTDIEDIRDDSLLYVDELLDVDKQFIFGLVSGGTKDLSRFRGEIDERMGTVPTESVDGAGPVSDIGSDPR